GQERQILFLLFLCPQFIQKAQAETRCDTYGQGHGHGGLADLLIAHHAVNDAKALSAIFHRHWPGKYPEVDELVPEFVRRKINILIHPPDIFIIQLLLAEPLHCLLHEELFFTETEIHGSLLTFSRPRRYWPASERPQGLRVFYEGCP